jgi:hypothetical protein
VRSSTATALIWGKDGEEGSVIEIIGCCSFPFVLGYLQTCHYIAIREIGVWWWSEERRVVTLKIQI